MYSERYIQARKEFINCLCLGFIGLGVPFILAFTEWWPIMRQEKKKALLAQNADSENGSLQDYSS